MKVYVDELPKNCEECPMCRSGKLKLQRKGRYIEAEQCVFGQYKYQTIDDEIDTCPLQSIAKHDKQVRKEVCDKIIKSIHYYPIALLDIDKEPRIKTLGISKEVLDTILKEYQK